MNARLLATVLLLSAAGSAAAPLPQGKPATATAPATPAAKPAAPQGQTVPGTPVTLEGRDKVDDSVPQKYRAEVASAQLEGARLQQEDFAVWVASGMLVRANLRAPGTATGWLAAPKDAMAQTWKVSFTSKAGDRQVVYADVDVDLTKPPPKVQLTPQGKGRELSADERVLVRDRDIVSAGKDWLRCADDYNYSATLRTGKKGRETVIRALPARHDQKLYVLGGFHEFTTPEKGGKMKHYAQTNSCIELPLPKNGFGLMVSHLRSNTPTLFHVFASLSYERPVYVKTGSRTWLVDKGLVTVVDKKSVKSLKTEKPAAN
jgi:hypothetical protein